MPKGKNELQRLNAAQANFDKLLKDLSETKEDFFAFDRVDNGPDNLDIWIANTKITLKSDGTYTTD